MQGRPVQYQCRLAQNADDLAAAQRLRYRVFVQELGGDGPLVDHGAGREIDRFDRHADHLILVDAAPGSPRTGEHVVGVYRVMTQDAARAAGQFYSEDEFDLSPLKQSGQRLLELGRSCLHPDHRGGMAMTYLWSALADYVFDRRIEILFGVASFHGTDTDRIAAPLSILHHRHLAPEGLRVRARPPHATAMDLLDEPDIDRVRAMRDTPALIKAYLRLGGCVGAGAYVDHAFNTTDVCLMMETRRIDRHRRDRYARSAR